MTDQPGTWGIEADGGAYDTNFGEYCGTYAPFWFDAGNLTGS